MLVLSCGPLLPVWMFINSMQLIVHLPLIRSPQPGNSHLFLLDHLNVLRMNFGSLNAWLQKQVGDSRLEDVGLVLNPEASYYTTLVYQCGYSFSLWPNLILTFCLLGLTLVIWLIMAGADLTRCFCTKHCVKGRCKRSCKRRCRRRHREQTMNNFFVRFLYEIFFEIMLCVMINVSYIDFGSARQSGAWALSIVLIVLTFVALVLISLTNWYRGPQVRGTYEKPTLWNSLWTFRPLRAEHL